MEIDADKRMIHGRLLSPMLVTGKSEGTAVGHPDSGCRVPVCGLVSATRQLGDLTESQFRHLKRKDDGTDPDTFRITKDSNEMIHVKGPEPCLVYRPGACRSTASVGYGSQYIKIMSVSK